MSVLALALSLIGCGAEKPVVGARDDYRIVVRRPGRLIASFPANDSTTIGRALAIEQSGADVLFLDQLDARVYRLSAAASMIHWFGRRGEGPGELGNAIALKPGRNGEVWISSLDLLRISRFSSEGDLLAEYRTPYPVVNFAVLGPDRPIVPFLAPGALLARLSEDGDTTAIPSSQRLSSGLADVRQRIGLHSMLMQAIDDSTLVVLRNKHSDDFEMWRIVLRADSARLVPIPLPEWLYRMMADETRILEGELDAEFLQSGDFMIPFKGLHRDPEGRLWLIPSPSHRVLALGLPRPGGMTIDLVAPSEREEHRGLLDAVVLGDRLYGLAETGIRVYGLEPDPGATLESVGIR